MAVRAAPRGAREERRAQQRAQSVVRALEMHDARLEYEGQPGKPQSARVIRGSQQEINVGCSGWFYWHWRDSFYPPGLPTSRWFEHYASRFQTVELNAPFYAWPTLATIAAWTRQTGRRRFTYTIKVNELITHTRRMTRTATLVKDFGLIADMLGPRFGCFLFQLPPSFKYSPGALARLLGQLDPRRRNVVEFRHRSWWNDRVFKAFEAGKTIFCSTSGPGLPDDLIKTADDIYIRFHGTERWYRHDYTNEELAVWAARIRLSGSKTVWAYFNNDREGFAIKNALELRRQLKRRPSKPKIG